MTSYKKVADELEKELKQRSEELQFLKVQLQLYEEQFSENIGNCLDSEEAKVILRMFANRAQDKHELVLLVRALSKIPA